MGRPWPYGNIVVMEPVKLLDLLVQFDLQALETVLLDAPWWPAITDLLPFLSGQLRRKRPSSYRWEPDNLPYFDAGAYPMSTGESTDFLLSNGVRRAGSGDSLLTISTSWLSNARQAVIDVLSRVPLYQSFRRWGWPRLLPVNVTASVTYRCNSRCRTCNVWRKRSDELSVEEWDRVFASLKRAPFWFTFSGGEPLLRADVVDIIERAYVRCRPTIINIPTNGLLPDRIVEKVAAVVERCSSSQVVVNLSLDGWEEQHDRIRNVDGNFRRAMETWQGLRAISAANLTLGVHTVISRYNVARIPALYERVRALAPDSYITEIAEERVELDTMGEDITPAAEDYVHAIRFLRARLLETPLRGIARVAGAFRAQYYDLAVAWLRHRRQVIPCYAGWASAQISPEGDVWFCCVRAEPIGSLREVAYDFRRLWFGERATAIRKTIKVGACHCPLANAAYTNILCHLSSLAQVGVELLRGELRFKRSAALGSEAAK